MKKKLKPLILSIVGFIPLQLYLVMIWLPEFLIMSGNVNNLDSRFMYSSEDVKSLILALGDLGIRFYRMGTIIDLFYALFMALVVFFLLRLVMGESIKRQVFVKITLLLPLIYLISDWIENIGIFIFLNVHFGELIKFVPLFSFFTTMKQIMALLAFVYLIILLIIRAVNRKV